jgi:hypothetical protein
MNEAEIDLHIREFGRLIEKAVAEGDRPAAVAWQAAMYEAIRSRTPEHKARLEAEIMERIENPANCFFAASGELGRFQRAGVVA